jgi:hypothetical protein
MPNSFMNETRTPEAKAVIQSPIGMNRKKMMTARRARKMSTRNMPGASADVSIRTPQVTVVPPCPAESTNR